MYGECSVPAKTIRVVIYLINWRGKFYASSMCSIKNVKRLSTNFVVSYFGVSLYARQSRFFYKPLARYASYKGNVNYGGLKACCACFLRVFEYKLATGTEVLFLNLIRQSIESWECLTGTSVVTKHLFLYLFIRYFIEHGSSVVFPILLLLLLHRTPSHYSIHPFRSGLCWIPRRHGKSSFTR